MSIADKLTTIAENEQKVYDAGFQAGSSQGGGTGQNPLEYSLKLDSVFDGSTFPENYTLTLDIPLVKSMNYILRNTTGLKKVVIKGKNDNANNCRYGFNANIEEIDFSNFTAKFNDLTYAFSNTILKKILGVLDFSEVSNTSNTFRNCVLLEEIRFKAETISLSVSFVNSQNLSAESIQSIIDGLATVDTAQTLTLHANLKILQSQVDSANDKGWTVAGGTVVNEEEYYA